MHYTIMEEDDLVLTFVLAGCADQERNTSSFVKEIIKDICRKETIVENCVLDMHYKLRGGLVKSIVLVWQNIRVRNLVWQSVCRKSNLCKSVPGRAEFII